MKNISRSKLGAVRVQLPPREEQGRIAASLEVSLGALASVLGDLSALERRVAVARRAVIQRVCMGTVRAVEAPGSAVTSPSDTAVGEGLASLPGDWRWSSLGELADVVGGVTKDAKKQDDPTYVEVPYLRVANVQDGALRLQEVSTIRVPEAKAEALRLLPGDVLMNEGGDRDKLGRGWVWDGQIADCIHQNHVYRARVRDGAIHPKLLSWHGNTFGRSWFESHGKQTTNLASISLTNVKRLPVPVPPVSEQTEMVQFIERHLEMLDAATAGISTMRRRCEALRRSILRTAFAGQLVQQDPSDEPADLLLKGIAETREGAGTAPKATTHTVRRTRTTDPQEQPA